MNVFKVSLRIYMELPIESDEDDDDLGVGEESEDTEIIPVDAFLHVGANNIFSATEEAMKHLESSSEGMDYEITGITLVDSLTIVNWPGEEKECNCVFCKAEKSAPEDVMEFSCSCGQDIRVVDGWDSINCPSCKREITRDKLVGSYGKWILINIKGTKS